MPRVSVLLTSESKANLEAIQQAQPLALRATICSVALAQGLSNLAKPVEDVKGVTPVNTVEDDTPVTLSQPTKDEMAATVAKDALGGYFDKVDGFRVAEGLTWQGVFSLGVKAWLKGLKPA